MTHETVSPRDRELPDIVHIVLTQIARLRAEGALSQPEFDSQLRRLTCEELQPRGFSLLVRELSDGHTRFLIKSRAGSVCDMIDCSASRS